MNNEVIQNVAESFPYIGAGVGVAVGAVGVWDIKRNLAQHRSNNALAEALDSTKPTSLRKRLITPALAVVAMCGVGGAIEEMAFRGEDIKVGAKPNIEMVVDHSFGVDTDGSIKTIDRLAVGIMSDEDTDTTAYIANGDADVTPTKSPKQVKDDNYFTGSKLLNKAIVKAIDNAGGKISVAPGENKSAAIVAITDGSSLGTPKNIIDASRAAGNVPIYIANVGEAKDADVKAFKAIKDETGGEYWKVDEKNAGAIEAKITEALKPSVIEVDNSNQRWILGILGATAILTGAGMWRSMRNDTFNTKLR